ncbi:MAG: ABC transporter permease [Candidatus Eisenbacteria bacterium]|uniref:ABC transporter permease n=1 Tax=Eiseniibacteriota bacterium TaxID=2212470 RepID=A0A7Y2H263_UNCEI|nr:ABC transporter permease [Candidatus Eisenbacteria bacterium]
MLRDILFIATKDLKFLLKQKETLLWTFVMPIAFFALIGHITAGFSSSGSSTPSLLITDEGDGGFLRDHVEQRLENQGYRIVHADTIPDGVTYLRNLTFPQGFESSILAGNPVKLSFRREGSNITGGDYDQIRLLRSIYTVIGDLIVLEQDDLPANELNLRDVATLPRTLTLKTELAGARIIPPTGFDQAVPGTMVMFTLLIMLTSGAILLVIERDQGLLRRLASAPMSRESIVLGKWGARMGLGFIQLTFAMIVGAVVFKVNWGQNLPMLSVVLITYGGLTAMLGILLGNLARTEAQATAVGVIASNVLAALGGCWWPIEITPNWMQQLANFLPTGWAMNALHQLVSFGQPASSAVPYVLLLLISSIVVGWIAARTFRFQ